MKQRDTHRKEEREGRGGRRSRGGEGGREIRLRKAWRWGEKREEAVKLEKDVSAGPDYRAYGALRPFIILAIKTSWGVTAGELMAGPLQPGHRDPRPCPRPLLTLAGRDARPDAQETGPVRRPSAAPSFPAWSAASRPEKAGQTCSQASGWKLGNHCCHWISAPSASHLSLPQKKRICFSHIYSGLFYFCVCWFTDSVSYNTRKTKYKCREFTFRPSGQHPRQDTSWPL